MSCGGGYLGFPIGIKNTHFVEDLPMIIPGQFGFNYPSGKSNAGKSYVVFGKADGSAINLSAIAAATGD
jgi:hypothetical protein